MKPRNSSCVAGNVILGFLALVALVWIVIVGVSAVSGGDESSPESSYYAEKAANSAPYRKGYEIGVAAAEKGAKVPEKAIRASSIVNYPDDPEAQLDFRLGFRNGMAGIK